MRLPVGPGGRIVHTRSAPADGLRAAGRRRRCSESVRRGGGGCGTARAVQDFCDGRAAGRASGGLGSASLCDLAAAGAMACS